MASLSCPSLRRSATSSPGYRQLLVRLRGADLRSLSSSPVASTSQSTLTPSRAHSTWLPLRGHAPLAPASSPWTGIKCIERQRMHRPAFQSRGMVTMTRQPEAPEEPEVFGGGEAPSVILTDRAIQHLSSVSTREKNPDLALRIAVESGGCHGYQYKMELTDEMDDDDFRFSSGDNVHLLVDSTSLRLIKGSTIDYVTELIGSQFAILNNPQAKGAGCGCGVSWEPNF